MKRVSTRGTCYTCLRTFSKAQMLRHIPQCLAAADAATREAPARTAHYLHLLVQGQYSPFYWLHLEMAGAATLRELDEFLRATWLECCGHLSMFEIEGRRYCSTVPDNRFGPKYQRMSIRLSEVLRQGITFHHEYDFGTPTELMLKVLGERRAPVTPGKIRLLARNEPPPIACGSCKQRATVICVECEEALCNSCQGQHQCDDEMRLPVVNSPRVGLCGYTGPTD